MVHWKHDPNNKSDFNDWVLWILTPSFVFISQVSRIFIHVNLHHDSGTDLSRAKFIFMETIHELQFVSDAIHSNIYSIRSIITWLITCDAKSHLNFNKEYWIAALADPVPSMKRNFPPKKGNRTIFERNKHFPNKINRRLMGNSGDSSFSYFCTESNSGMRFIKRFILCKIFIRIQIKSVSLLPLWLWLYDFACLFSISHTCENNRFL